MYANIIFYLMYCNNPYSHSLQQLSTTIQCSLYLKPSQFGLLRGVKEIQGQEKERLIGRYIEI